MPDPASRNVCSAEVEVHFGRWSEPPSAGEAMGARMVPSGVRSRVRRSAQAHASEAAGHMHSQSSPPSPSFLVLQADEHDFSEGAVAARATESARASYADKPGQPEYPSHNFNDLAEWFQLHAGTEKQYLGDISHELRAPISRIRVLLERARRSPQEICSYLARIEENVLRMEALTKRLLDFSRLELIEESLTKEPCDLAELVCRVVEDARIEAEARGCTIKHLAIPSCLVSANYELLRRAVENVVRNSVQYTRENSLVSVVLSCPSNRMAQILVEDEGPGISEEELEEVFKPFYRAAHARVNGTLGAGLGLAISERAVKLHCGSINARNRSDGKGLQVTVQIPLLNVRGAHTKQHFRKTTARLQA
jgi:signal transduction histidine kinase